MHFRDFGNSWGWILLIAFRFGEIEWHFLAAILANELDIKRFGDLGFFLDAERAAFAIAASKVNCGAKPTKTSSMPGGVPVL